MHGGASFELPSQGTLVWYRVGARATKAPAGGRRRTPRAICSYQLQLG